MRIDQGWLIKLTGSLKSEWDLTYSGDNFRIKEAYDMKVVIVVLVLLLMLAPFTIASAQKDNEVYLPTNRLRIPQEAQPTETSAVTPGKKKIGIKEACKILREILLPLEKGIRADILKNLPPGEFKTFSMLKEEMGVPSSTLYSNLKALEDLGYVRKTDEWPARYAATPDIEYVRSIATDIKMREMERLKCRFEEFSPEVEG